MLTTAVLAGGVAGHTVRTFVDPKKGSLTNKAECAKEHLKNDLKASLALGIPAGGIAVVAARKGLATKIATKVGKYASNVFSKIGSKLASTKAFSKIGKGLSKVASFMAKHPLKAGAIGLFTTAGLYFASTIAKYAKNEGRIDQKYEDAAKIEGSTKNVILR